MNEKGTQNNSPGDGWPSQQDYKDHVQHPDLSFTDIELKNCEPSFHPKRGTLLCSRGKFALVFPLQMDGKRKYAIKCFINHQDDRLKRYQAISRYFSNNHAKWSVQFDYQQKGMMIAGTMYPILKMEWVHGKTLINWLNERLDNNEIDRISGMASRWKELINSLRNDGVAHGDLQHGNILITDNDDDIKLIDYDGMYVPEIKGLKPHEAGLLSYQHPARLVHFDAGLDNFSALVIYVALKSIAADPGIRTFCDEEHLLFNETDFVELDTPIFRQIDASNDPEVRRLSKDLKEICRIPYEQIPWFSDVLEGKWIYKPSKPKRKIAAKNKKQKRINNRPVFAAKRKTAGKRAINYSRPGYVTTFKRAPDFLSVDRVIRMLRGVPSKFAILLFFVFTVNVVVNILDSLPANHTQSAYKSYNAIPKYNPQPMPDLHFNFEKQMELQKDFEHFKFDAPKYVVPKITPIPPLKLETIKIPDKDLTSDINAEYLSNKIPTYVPPPDIPRSIDNHISFKDDLQKIKTDAQTSGARKPEEDPPKATETNAPPPAAKDVEDTKAPLTPTKNAEPAPANTIKDTKSEKSE